jgi:NAD(P)-dependent dehydrogenase (short-subunit alcohol dehydrogenase family)
MQIADSAVLITGANRGIGRALVEAALARGARRVYAGTRVPFAHPDRRVTALTLDVTDAEQIAAAAAAATDVDILVNNAGLAVYEDLADSRTLDRHLGVNLYGTYEVTQAFLPTVTRARGAIVNVLSVAALAAVPVLPAYSISKAAEFNMTQSLRALLAGQGVRVHAALLGPVDTDMTRGLDIPKATPEAVAQAILNGVERDADEIFPDPLSESLAAGWLAGPAKALERENAALVQAQSAVTVPA